MKWKAVLAPLAIAGVALAAFAPGVVAQEGPPPPSAGSVLASGVFTTGAAIGPDGALYAGIGGTAEPADDEVTLPAEMAEAFGIDSVWFGLHSKVVRVDPDTGEVTDYAEGLPSVSDEFGGDPFASPSDVIWVGDTLYALLTGGQPEGLELPGDQYWPNGVYRHEDDGSWTLVADILQYNLDNPVDFPDADPAGNPFAIDYRDGRFIISDGNHNRILRSTMDGAIDTLASFDNVVPTGLAAGGSGAVLNTHFSPAPHFAEDSHVVSIAYPTGEWQIIAGGTFAQVIDVEFGPGGKTYVLQMGDQSLDEEAPPPPGRLLVLEDGELKPIVTGLMLATSVNFAGETAYVTSLTGDVIEIPGVSALEPVEGPAPQPTTAPPAATPTRPSGNIRPPDTGTGGDAAAATPWLAVAMIAVAATGAAGVAFATRRAR